jgi:HEAT repeat protein
LEEIDRKSSSGRHVRFFLTLAILFVCASCGMIESQNRKEFTVAMNEKKSLFLKNGDLAALKEIETFAGTGTSVQRSSALVVIGSIILIKKTVPPTTKPVLLECLDSDDVFVRKEAAIAIRDFISELNGEFAEAIPELMKIIRKYPGTDASLFATESLGHMRGKAIVAIPVLEEASKATDKELRAYALEAIEMIRAGESK